jgi:hypothetical protein
MLKLIQMREEDYWIFPIIGLTTVAVGFAMYASVFMFRGPALVCAGLGLWFIYAKMARSYSVKRARYHVAATIGIAALLTYVMYFLTK